jgi:hypothetical protein
MVDLSKNTLYAVHLMIPQADGTIWHHVALLCTFTDLNKNVPLDRYRHFEKLSLDPGVSSFRLSMKPRLKTTFG